MDGIAFKDNSEARNNDAWKNLIPHLAEEFDLYSWLYDCQASWDVSDLDYTAIDKLADHCLMDHPDFEMTSIHIIKKGYFRKAFPLLNVDEWTYLLGFKDIDNDLDKILQDFNLIDGFLSPGIFEFLNLYEGILIAQIDGWWECFPSDHLLMKNFSSELLSTNTNSDKWIKFDKDNKTDIYPNFDRNN